MLEILNLRFFVADPRETDRSGNPRAGLVVDSGICHPMYVFILAMLITLKARVILQIRAHAARERRV